MIVVDAFCAPARFYIHLRQQKSQRFPRCNGWYGFAVEAIGVVHDAGDGACPSIGAKRDCGGPQ